MVAEIEVGDVELSVIMYHQDTVVALEFSQVFTSSVIIKAKYVTVEPNFSSAQSRTSTLLQGDLVHRKLG